MEMMKVLLSSGIIAAIVSLIIGLITNRHSKNELYAQTISSNRIKWIQEVRENLVSLIVLCRKGDIKENDKIEFEKCRMNIILRLNPDDKKNEYSNELNRLLSSIEIDPIKGIFYRSGREKSVAEDIQNIGQNLLRKEWKRVKVEAGETIGKREEIDSRLEEIDSY